MFVSVLMLHNVLLYVFYIFREVDMITPGGSLQVVSSSSTR